MNGRTLLLILTLCIAIPTTGLAERVDLPPLVDTYISSVDSTLSFSGSTTLSVKSVPTFPSGSIIHRALLKFDLSGIPADADINLAYLYVYESNTNTSDATVHEVTSAWIGNEVKWINQPSYDAASLGRLEGYADSGWAYVDLTELVRDWHGGTRSNHGVTIAGGMQVMSLNPRLFHSEEHSMNPPKLMVIFDSESSQLNPEADAHVSINNPSGKYGAEETLLISQQGVWSLLRFDVSGIPADATIEYARLRMYHYSGSDPMSSFCVGAHLVSSAWDETTVDWTSVPTYFPSPPYVDGEVGLSGVFPSEPWWLDLNVTTYVETWHMTPSSNFGVLVKNPLDGGSGSSGPTGSFRSREYGTAAYRPVLEVYYTAPPPNRFGPPTSLSAVFQSDAAWGDWDNDGDLDLVLCGDTGTGYVTKTYENVGGTLVEVPNTIPGIKQDFASGCLAWADFDNDGDLDLSLAGYTGTSNLTRIYVNDGTGAFVDSVTSPFPALRYASLAWGDYDLDGDLDLYIQGNSGAMARSILYGNDGGTLTFVKEFSPRIYGGTADWVDWDGDGDLDLLTTGSTGAARKTVFHRNDGGAFTSLGNRGLPEVCYSDMAWGDYDRDGDPDLAFVGQANDPALESYTRIYWNDGEGNLNHAWWLLGSAPQLRLGGCAWGDYDNDGRLDLVVSGYEGPTSCVTQVYHNEGTDGFALDDSISLQGTYYGNVTWADVDSDFDLDLLVTGRDIAGTAYTELYPNENGVANTPPAAPNSFTTVRRGSWVPFGERTLYMQWGGASDGETAQNGLYYCIRVGTSPGSGDICTGLYGSPLMGNMGEANRLEVTIPDTEQRYYWAVRTIDSGLLASDWSVEQCSWAPDSLWDYEDDPIDDAFVCTKEPDTCYGATADLINLFVGDFGGGSTSRAYLMFSLSMLDTAKVERAELYAYCRGANPASGNMVAVYGEFWDDWEEATVCWYNAPTAFHPYPWDIAEATPGAYVAWDVTKAVEAMVDHKLTLVLMAYNPPEGWSGAFAEFNSKEYDNPPNPPYLKITYSTVVGVDDTPRYTTLVLGQNVPNPFNPQTRISYTIPHGPSTTPVSLRVYDVAGRLVRTLVNAPESPGIHVVGWDGTDDRNARVASGVYFYRLLWNKQAKTKKMLLLK
jgi:hypothetical protein